ncbi:hypothetical protein MTR67_017753 [Solanum verrucosum]|uniref:Uncharacterized protein n=1 Tax=Solanum verrucosum TaxID=315347 RepID=A0AAF0TSE7_SOLVR|nr:hypothetical protein MTR67_017753 [Solanum verrucosum]
MLPETRRSHPFESQRAETGSFGFDVKLEIPVVFSACRRTKIIRFIPECKESDVLGDYKAGSNGHGENVPKRF